MNILLLTNHLDTGGITSYALSLGKGLRARGHAVYIASSGGEALTRFTEAGIAFIPIPIRTKSEAQVFKLGTSFFILLKNIREKNIQVIHSNSRVTQVLGYMLAKKTRIPHVTTWHGFFRRHWFRKFFPFWADRIIAISESVQAHLQEDFQAEKQNIRLVYNGIDMERLKLKEIRSRSEVKKRLDVRDGPVIGIIARLSDVKGHRYLIQAMHKLIKEFPDAQLLIVGEGRMERDLKILVQELGIGKNVIFIPKAANIPEYLYVMDVFVMPSLKEGLGLGLMEAMAWGKAVVGSRVGGITNLIRSRENGLLVDPQDPAGLCEAIKELIKDPVRASVMGNNARRFIQDNFSLEKMAQQTEGVYTECVNTGV
jgi:glycosyltransferase involved in cell wall biosynthesis